MTAASNSSRTEQVDAIVVGGGIAGLTAALSIARAGVRTVCIEKSELRAGAIDDCRTTALFPPSRQLLERLGVWGEVQAQAEPLRTIRIVDRGARPQAKFVTTRLQSRDINAPCLAHNLPNPALHQALATAAADEPSLELLSPDHIVSLVRRDDAAIAVLASGRHLRAQLVIAADGRDSPTRAQAGISAWQCDHGRKVLVFHARCERNLNGVCTETHGEGNVLTLVPLPNAQAAVVWVMPGPTAVRYAKAAPDSWAHAMNRLNGGTGGFLHVTSPVQVWPEATLLARRLVGRRLVLIAEAAHAMSPVGAQGLNLSMADIERLSQYVAEAISERRDIGDPTLLHRFERTQWPQVAARVASVEMYSTAAAASSRNPLVPARRAALRVLAGFAPLRRAAVRVGTGVHRTPLCHRGTLTTNEPRASN